MKFYKLEDGSGRYLGMRDSVSAEIMEQIPELISNGLVDTSFEKTYSEEEFQLETNLPYPTWENTLTSHQERSSCPVLMELVHQLGYVYFVWNGHLHKVTNYHQNLSYELVEDIYFIDIK